jgi:alpha-glucuronidase
MVARWETLHGKVDEERYAALLVKLQRQAEDAAAWRDHCLHYFQQFSGRPLSDGEPAHDGRVDHHAPGLEGVER